MTGEDNGKSTENALDIVADCKDFAFLPYTQRADVEPILPQSHPMVLSVLIHKSTVCIHSPLFDTDVLSLMIHKCPLFDTHRCPLFGDTQMSSLW